MPLQHQVALDPFDKWGMDFIGPNDPPSRKNKYIIVCTEYLKKWAETKVVKATKKEKVAELLKENIFYKYGYLREIFIDQRAQFTSHFIENILR